MNITAYIGRMVDALGWRPSERQLVWARAADSRTDIGDIDRMRLVALSRKLYLNNAIVKGGITDLARYSVGSGIKALPRSGDPSWDTEAKNWWKHWQRYPEVTGKFDFQTLQLLVSECIDRDGELFILLTKSDDERTAQLQVIEGHRVQTPPEMEGREDVFDGVQIDKVGRPKNYWILTSVGEFKKIPARDMIHIFEPERPDQVRGYPRISAAINTCLDRDELLRLEMQAAKAASVISLVVKSKTGSNSGIFGPITPDYASINDDQRAMQTVWGGGAILNIRQDQDVSSFQMDRPNNKLDSHLEQYIRATCLALGLPYEFVWDSAKISGANTRLITAKAARRFEQRQNLLVAQLMRRVWRYAAAVAIKNGDLPETDRWHHVEWIPPRSITVDHGRDAQSDIALVEAGLMSRAEYFATWGQDWEEEMAQIAAERGKFGPVQPVNPTPVVIPAPLPPRVPEE